MEKRLSKKTRLLLAGALAFAAGALFVLFGGTGGTQVYADEILYSGTDGDLDWSITESGVLTIEGTGDYACDYAYDSSLNVPGWVEYASDITSAVVSVDGITSTSYMFYYLDSMTSIDLSGLDTSKVTDMSYMFYHCEVLYSLDVSGFDTSNVTNMKEMFHYCMDLVALDATSFDTSKVTNMAGMFQNCNDMATMGSLKVSGFDTSNVTDMSYMFALCQNVKSLDLSGYDTSKVTNMEGMFESCFSLSSLDISNFSTGNVTNTSAMFFNCTSLTSIDLSDFDTSSLTNMSHMFYGCTGLTTVSFDNCDLSKVNGMAYMFYNCKNLESLDLSNFGTQKSPTMQYMFYNCSSLTSLDLTALNFSTFNSATYVEYMLEGCSSLTSVKMPSAIPYAVDLPSADGYYWADAYASTCTAVTAGLSTTMTYYRYADDEEAVTYQTETTTQAQTTTQSQTTTTQAATTTTQNQTTTTKNQTTTTQSQTTTTGQSTASQTTTPQTTTEEPAVVVADDDIDLTQTVADDTQVDVNLAAPLLTCTANESEGVLVEWEAVEGATSYRVYRQTGSDGWEAVADTAALSYTDTAAESGSVCAYTVCAVLTDAGSEQRSESAAGKSTVRLETPAVSGVTRDGLDPAKITVRWQGAGTVTGYQIQYSADASFEEGTITLTIESQSATSAEILTAAGGNVYVRVRSYILTTSGAKYFSDWSEAYIG